MKTQIEVLQMELSSTQESVKAIVQFLSNQSEATEFSASFESQTFGPDGGVVEDESKATNPSLDAVKQNDDYYYQYFATLFTNKSDSSSNVSIYSASSSPSSFLSALTLPSSVSTASRNQLRRGLSTFLKKSLSSLFTSVSTPHPNPESSDSLTELLAEFYLWCHFHISDMLVMIIFISVFLMIMMCCLSFFMVVSLLSQRKSG
jgi:hypothetical protein